MPPGARTSLVVPGPNGRGEVQVTPASMRHQDSVSSDVRSVQTASAGREISIVSAMRCGAGPMLLVSLVGGALADRLDRRLLLAIAQVAAIAPAGALAVAAFTGRPPVVVVLVLGGVLAGGSALDGVTRAAIIPNVLGPE